jgi:hypothetical protein
MADAIRRVDHKALKVNQYFVIILALAAFISGVSWIALGTGVVMAAGTIFGKPGFYPLYALLKKLKLAKPEPLEDNPEPHRFAQGFGAAVLLGGSAALLAGQTALGWALVWLVIVLAGLNAFAGFCAGCFVYYQIAKLGLPGFFSKRPPEGSTPGFAPKPATAQTQKA